jgi:hypothetical protein
MRKTMERVAGQYGKDLANKLIGRLQRPESMTTSVFGPPPPPPGAGGVSMGARASMGVGTDAPASTSMGVGTDAPGSTGMGVGTAQALRKC